MSNEVRIIGGVWRSRKLRFPAVNELRPTPDRVRETLFNWLQGEVEGSHCLDLFAGSGALGFEAASRGAARVVAVERNPRVCAALRQNCALLDARQIEVVQTEARRYLARPAHAFDLVFLDPPFRRDLVAGTCQTLASRGWLSDNAWIYVETEAEYAAELPADWQLVHVRDAGDVRYHLCRRGPH
ncbi:MAG: 16S rRNA (guanine(966)-N(2))-methyltransferase RsmD [Methylotetracoccus sp.]